jgi:hypothetical protein
MKKKKKRGKKERKKIWTFFGDRGSIILHKSSYSIVLKTPLPHPDRYGSWVAL